MRIKGFGGEGGSEVWRKKCQEKKEGGRNRKKVRKLWDLGSKRG